MHIAGPTPTGPVAAECSALVGAAPDRVDGQSRRKISPANTYASAWGAPAIVLTCGGSAPAGLTLTSFCSTIDGVDWLATQAGKEVDPAQNLSGDLTFTTVGRSAYVSVVVPDHYQPAANVLVDLAKVVKGATTETKPCQ